MFGNKSILSIDCLIRDYWDALFDSLKFWKVCIWSYSSIMDYESVMSCLFHACHVNVYLFDINESCVMILNWIDLTHKSYHKYPINTYSLILLTHESQFKRLNTILSTRKTLICLMTKEETCKIKVVVNF